MATDVGGSVTRYIRKLKADVPDAVQPLWERYFETLVRLARTKLRATPRGAADEEDVALSAFDSFFAGAKRGKFPQLEDRNDLWKILVTVTDRKAYDLARHEGRWKRGKGRVLTEADVRGEADVLSLIAASEPSPEFAAMFAEECRRLLVALDDDVFRRIALDRMAGYKDKEIADRLGCSRRTVMRKLVMIRNAWREEVGECVPSP